MKYTSSKGEIDIATMPLSYAKNALNKLRRAEPERTAEIEALAAHVDKLETEAVEASLNPRAVIGGNNPPEETPPPKIEGRKAIEVHVADLLADVQGLCLTIEADDQANTVGRIHRDLQTAVKLVNSTADEEKRPHNEAIAEISSWQNSYTAAKLKRTPDGSLTKALLVTQNLTSAWLRKQDDERKAREAKATEAALAAAQEAAAARAEAKTTTDIDVVDRAEDALSQARSLLKAAEGVAREKVQVGGGEGYRAMGLRSNWQARSTGTEKCWNEALAHYGKNPEFRAELQALIQKWADRDARSEAARALGVPGFTFIDEKVAA